MDKIRELTNRSRHKTTDAIVCSTCAIVVGAQDVDAVRQRGALRSSARLACRRAAVCDDLLSVDEGRILGQEERDDVRDL